MGELSDIMTPNRIQVAHTSAKQLLWTQLGQCKSAEAKSAIKLTGILFLFPKNYNFTRVTDQA